MLELNKKQVKGILNILKNKHTNGRPGIQQLNFEGKYVYATNGFSIIRFELENEHQNEAVTSESLERWYKLATNKDTLTGEDLENLAETPEFKGISNLASLFDALGEIAPLERISFNLSLLKDISQILGVEEITLGFRGIHKPITVQGIGNTNNIEAMFLPIRRSDDR